MGGIALCVDVKNVGDVDLTRTEMMINKRIRILLPFFLVLGDYLSVIAAEQCAFVLRNWIMSGGPVLRISWLNFWIVFPAFYLLFINIERLYSRRAQFWQIIKSIFYCSIYAIIAIIIELYVAQLAGSTSRLFVGLLWIFSFMFLVISRFFIKKLVAKYEILQLPVLIIGAGKTAEILVKGIAKEESLGYKIIGFLEDININNGLLKEYPLLGCFGDAEKVIQKSGVKHVFIAAPGMEQEALLHLINRIQPLVKNVAIIPNLIGMPMGSLEVESLYNERIMILRVKNNLARMANRIIKLVFDYTLTVLGTIVIAPILLAIAVWVYKDSPGPVIFKHIRVGKNGQAFPCYKFRTMCVDAQEKLAELLANNSAAKEEWERDFKLKDDPRITKSGAFLRKTSLDELPQIFNVLRGEMSLVGPRPVIDEELERYGEYLDDYLMIKPGITGMWQVNGRSDTTYEERVQMDSWYVRNWSVWLDIMLLWKTVKAVVKSEGAY